MIHLKTIISEIINHKIDNSNIDKFKVDKYNFDDNRTINPKTESREVVYKNINYNKKNSSFFNYISKINIFSFAFLILSSCGDTELKKVELLDGFRILAITTSTPEVNPGDTVSDIQVFFSDPQGAGRLISGTTVSCIDPGIALGALVSCDHDPMSVAGVYNIDTALDDDTAGLFTGLASTTASVTVPANILLGRSLNEQNNGVGYIIIFSFDVDGQQVKTFKRILASTRTVKNLNPGNPTPSTVQLNGGALGLPNTDDVFRVLSTTEENYDFITTENTTENRLERFQVAWYISSGELNIAKSNVSENISFISESAQSPFTLITVIRDERGGTEIQVFNF
jgi:hypothetical protein